MLVDKTGQGGVGVGSEETWGKEVNLRGTSMCQIFIPLSQTALFLFSDFSKTFSDYQQNICYRSEKPIGYQETYGGLRKCIFSCLLLGIQFTPHHHWIQGASYQHGFIGANSGGSDRAVTVQPLCCTQS